LLQPDWVTVVLLAVTKQIVKNISNSNSRFYSEGLKTEHFGVYIS
jgi:hypothetical protein